MVNKKQDDQVSRQVNEVNSTISSEKSKINVAKPDANAQTKQRDEQIENTLQIKPAKNLEPNASKQNLAAEEPEYKIVKTRNDIDPNKLSASRWQFTDADDNNKAIAGSTIIITGNSGDTFTKDQITLPKGYEDRNDLLGKNAVALKLPAAGTITTYTLPLSHHHTDLTKQAPEDEVKQTRTVTVHYKYLDGDKANQEAAPDAKLDVYYSRNKFKDDVTGEISYTHWSWDKSQGDPEHPGYHIVSGKWDNLPEQWDNVIANVPTIAGYTAILDEPNRPDNTNHVNANKFVHPLWNNSFGSGMTDAKNGDKFANYLVNHDSFDESFDEIGIDVDVKSVTTDNAKLLQLLTNDVQHNSATRTIVFTFPANYSPDLTKYHLTKTGNTYQIKQSADYNTSYAQGTVLINATDDITKHHIDTTKPYKLSDTWQPNYDTLVLSHKNADGTVSFDKVQLPKVPGYTAKVIRSNGLLMVSYLVFAPEKPATNNNLNELQFSNKLVTNSAVNSNIVVKSDMYQVVNDDHNWQLPVIKSYDLKFATNKNQIIFVYTKDKQYNCRFVLTFKDGQYQLATFNKQGKLLKTYSIKSYKKLAKIIHSLVSMNIA